MELLQVRNQKIAADRVACTDMKLPEAKRACIEKLALPACEQIHCRLHMLKECKSRRCELHLFCAADKERLSELFFKSLYRLADRRLGDEELFARIGKA